MPLLPSRVSVLSTKWPLVATTSGEAQHYSSDTMLLAVGCKRSSEYSGANAKANLKLLIAPLHSTF